MSTLRLPGLQTGIDTAALIQQLMTVERRTINTWENRKSLWQDRLSALDTLESKLRNLRSSVRALSDAEQLRSFSASTSDDEKITAEATNNAFEGSHTVVVNQLANAERWVHTTGLEYAEDYVGAGTFVYSYNYKETSITTTATTTLNDLVGLINNDANNPGVVASLVRYNDAYHLVLNGNDAGGDYGIRINLGTTEVKESDSEFTKGTDNATLSTKITELDQFDWNGDEELFGDEKITIDGTDHFGVALPQVEFDVTADTTIGRLIAEINNAFDGRAKAVFENGRIILTDSEDGASSLSITIAYDKGSGNTDLSNLAVNQTNAGTDDVADITNFLPSTFTISQAAADSKIKVGNLPGTSITSEEQEVTLSAAAASGTYTLTYRGETTTAIAYNANATTIQDALNALDTVTSGDITVSGDPISTGMKFTFDSSLGNVDLIMINSSLKDAGAGDITASIAETVQGSDGYIRRSSNTVDDVIGGVALHLHDTTDANGEKITLTRDIQSVKDKISKMVTAYNSAVTHIKEVTGYNSVTETAGILMGDYVVSTIQYKFREPLIEQAAGFLVDLDTFLTPVTIGLELDRDGLLNFDTNVFDEAVAENYLDVLDLIGADKTGSSNSSDVEFYGASSNYTTAGTYDVKVNINGETVESVQIKLSSESTYRTMDYSITEKIATGDSTFDSNGDPLYPENALQLTIDKTNMSEGDNDYTVYVKQGFTGKIEDSIDKMLKATVGSIVIDKDNMGDQIDYLDEKIEDEEYRLGKREERLILRFARLEKTLALLQNQMAAAGVLSTLI